MCAGEHGGVHRDHKERRPPDGRATSAAREVHHDDADAAGAAGARGADARERGQGRRDRQRQLVHQGRVHGGGRAAERRARVRREERSHGEVRLRERGDPHAARREPDRPAQAHRLGAGDGPLEVRPLQGAQGRPVRPLRRAQRAAHDGRPLAAADGGGLLRPALRPGGEGCQLRRHVALRGRDDDRAGRRDRQQDAGRPGHRHVPDQLRRVHAEGRRRRPHRALLAPAAGVRHPRLDARGHGGGEEAQGAVLLRRRGLRGGGAQTRGRDPDDGHVPGQGVRHLARALRVSGGDLQPVRRGRRRAGARGDHRAHGGQVPHRLPQRAPDAHPPLRRLDALPGLRGAAQARLGEAARRPRARQVLREHHRDEEQEVSGVDGDGDHGVAPNLPEKRHCVGRRLSLRTKCWWANRKR